MKKDVWKRIIADSFEKNLSYVISRDLEVPFDLNKIISIVGVRRSGKTHFLFSLIQQLRKRIDPRSTVYINFEDDRLFPLQLSDMDVFLKGYYELYPDLKDKLVYFFFDEIQNVPNWEKFLRRLYDTEKSRIFITGSSSTLMSKEIATSLRGRTVTFEVFPLSFREYLRFQNVPEYNHTSQIEATIKNYLVEYINHGGFPETVGLKPEFITKVLHEYLELIMYRDVVERHGAQNTFLLRFLMKYCFVNLSSLLSYNKLFNDLRSQGLQLSKNTIYDYIGYLEDAYALFTVPMASKSVREEMRNPKKLYSVDHGFKGLLDSSFSTDTGHIYENMVFLELRKQIREIYYLKGKREVDFFFTDAGKKNLINVCYDIEDPTTKKGEIQGLLEAMTTHGIHNSLLITAEVEDEIILGGKKIQIVPLWKWLIRGKDKAD
jgi:uncharacterized protein